MPTTPQVLELPVNNPYTTLQEFEDTCHISRERARQILLEEYLPNLYDTNEAARMLGISYVTVYRWIKAGKLIPVRVDKRTLIPKSEIERLKKEKNEQAAAEVDRSFKFCKICGKKLRQVNKTGYCQKHIIGSNKLWTQERVIAALRLASQEINGPLPCSSSLYNQLKRGQLDWPTSHHICEYFGSMARAWIAAGAPMSRVTLKNLEWLPDEDQYLLDHAGTLTLRVIAKRLGRTYPAVCYRLQYKKIRALDNEGYFSAVQMAKELHCSCDRLRRFLNARMIKGAKFDRIRNRWKIDLFSITANMKALLTAPRRTHKTWESDVR